jgi:hypothetical protein
MITTVIMPYSNFEDAKSVISLYKNSLDTDQDMNFAEFIGEKLLASGINFDDEDETPMQSKNIPVSHNLITQIQSGVIFHKKEPLFEFLTFNLPQNIFSLKNEKTTKDKFQLGILRPPIC